MPRFVRSSLATPVLWLALAAAALCRPAAGDSSNDDGVPRGAMAFLVNQTACPEGWAAATYTRGRLIVGTSNGAQLGLEVGMPLGDQEDRKHQHPYAATVELGYKSIAAAGGGNNEGALAQSYSWKDALAAAPSGLPFIQLLACEKQ